MSNLYEKHNFLNKDIKILCNTYINEYDMKAGGYSILKRKNALSDFEIDYLEKCTKMERNIYLGNKVRECPALNKMQIEGFVEARQMFFEANNIEDNSVLSIKKDAIFLIKKNVPITELDGLTFRLANVYNSYYYINGIEFYYKSSSNKIDVKGIGDNLYLHENHFLKDLATIFGLAEKNNKEFLIKYLKRYRRKYLRRELDIECYREFNQDSMFRYKDPLSGNYILSESEVDVDNIEIGYNYMNYIVPLISYYL